jgi:hypothetical protein
MQTSAGKGRIQIKHECDIRLQALGSESVQLADEIEIQLAAVTLKRNRGVRVPIRQHDAPPVERRSDHIGYVFGSRTNDQK